MLLATCGSVSFAHGSNDGQKGMGLILLVLIGFLPTYYALDLHHPERATEVREAAVAMRVIIDEGAATSPASSALRSDLDSIISVLPVAGSFTQVPADARWEIRESIFRVNRAIDGRELPPALRTGLSRHRAPLTNSIEYVPVWVVLGVAMASAPAR